MKISQSYKLFTFTIILLLAIIVIVVFKMLNIQDDIIKSEQHRFRSFSLAAELFQSSEDLTRMARSYVSTGDTIYEKSYFEILDIRNGQKPRPAHYNATYWHLVGVGRGPAVAQGETMSLQELMRREGFTEQEFSLLRKSQANSDHLVIMEKQAFAALKGLYDDGQGNFTVRRAPNRDYAIRLLFSREYSDEKARIMAPIEQFMDVLDKRTHGELISFQSQLRQYIYLALAFIIITLCIVIIMISHAFRSILRPIGHLQSEIAEIESGNFAARSESSSTNEIGELSKNFNGMVSFIETAILKREQAENDLNERLRELTCLYSISAMIESPGISLEEILKKTVMLIPPAMKFPEITQASIELEGQFSQTAQCRETPWAMEQTITVSGKPAGQLKVCYLEERQASDEGPFLIEERQLIKTVAERIGHVVERIRAEDELRESEERIHAITNSAYEAIMMMDNNGSISYWNPAAECILGYTREEAIGKNLHKLITPEKFLSAHLAAFPEFQKTGQGNAISKSLELVARRKDGEEIDVALSLSAVKIQGAWNAVGILQDITERKKAEEALKYNETFLNTLLNSIPIPVFYKDREGRYTGFNRAFETFFGATKEQLVGKTVFDINAPELAKIYHAKDNELFESGGEQHYETQVKNAQGITRDVIFSKAVFIDSHGNVNGLIGTILDITQRKLMESMLRESDERYKALFDSSLDLVYLYDFEGRFIDANTAALNRFGYKREEIPSLNFASLLSEDQLQLAFKTLQEIQETGIQKNLTEFRLRHKDGSDIYLEAIGSAIMSDGKPVAIQSIARDITERKRTEKKLEESEKKYRLIADNMTDTITIIDMNLRFTYVSPSIMRMRGYTPEEALAQTLEQATTRESMLLVASVYEEEMQREASGTADPDRVRIIELEQYRKDMSTIWVEISLSFLRDAHGRPTGMLSLTRDITERKQAEEKLSKQAEELRVQNEEMTRFNQVAVGREMQMIELKREINELYRKLGETPRYRIPEAPEEDKS